MPRTIKKNSKVETLTNPRVHLSARAEKLKRQMSANSITLPFNIERFMEGKDIEKDDMKLDEVK
jgi:hypothetical protein